MADGPACSESEEHIDPRAEEVEPPDGGLMILVEVQVTSVTVVETQRDDG